MFCASMAVLRFLPARELDEEPADMPWLETEPATDGEVPEGVSVDGEPVDAGSRSPSMAEVIDG